MELQNETLSALECPICKNYLYAPIRMCPGGHSVCEKCFMQIRICPLCRKRLKKTIEVRNYSLENVAEKLKFPCQYKEFGCNFINTPAMLKLHHEFCEYGEVACPLTGCKWVGTKDDFFQHAKSCPNNTVQEITSNCFFIWLRNRPTGPCIELHFGLIWAFEKIFKYGVLINFFSNTIQICVQFMGPKKEAGNYSFLLTSINDRDCKIIGSCIPVVNGIGVFDYTENTLIEGIVRLKNLRLFCIPFNGLKCELEIKLTKDVQEGIRKRRFQDSNSESTACKRPKS